MKIGIYALGLIGGSILKALRDEELFVVTRNQETLKALGDYNLNASTGADILKDCEVVFVCTPMRNTLEALKLLDNVVRPETIVADVSSLKEFVMKDVHPYKFIGSHPMAGTENSGFDSSFAELFRGAKWVICPSSNVNDSDVEKFTNLIKKTGASPVFMDAAKHDCAAALISHMPMLLSQALMDCTKGNSDALTLAASGFRDMTRLSLSNIDMASDMLRMNQGYILEALDALKSSVEGLISEGYEQKVKLISERRKALYDEKGKNIYN